MPIPQARDPQETRAGLARWLGARPGISDVRISELTMPHTTGFSHETLMFTADWTREEVAQTERLVARVEPSQHTVFLEPDFETEYQVIKALQTTDVPIARAHGFESDRSYLGAPFYVIEYVDGRIPDDNPPYTFGGWLLESTPEQQARVWWSGFEAMARVHTVDWRALSLDSLRRPSFGGPGIDEQLGYYARYYKWAREGSAHATIDAALGWLDDNRPDEERLSLCWGDARLGNQIFRDFSCVAVLDWEMAAIADPEMDLAWWLYFDRLFSEGLGQARPPGFPSPDATAERYEQLTGRTPQHLEYYEVFAALRFALILMRLSRLMVTFELSGDADMGENSFAVQFLEKILASRG
jgi:aminoglycoside phosphotransferase (APT) family kinase protein